MSDQAEIMQDILDSPKVAALFVETMIPEAREVLAALLALAED